MPDRDFSMAAWLAGAVAVAGPLLRYEPRGPWYHVQTAYLGPWTGYIRAVPPPIPITLEGPPIIHSSPVFSRAVPVHGLDPDAVPTRPALMTRRCRARPPSLESQQTTMAPPEFLTDAHHAGFDAPGFRESCLVANPPWWTPALATQQHAAVARYDADCAPAVTVGWMPRRDNRLPRILYAPVWDGVRDPDPLDVQSRLRRWQTHTHRDGGTPSWFTAARWSPRRHVRDEWTTAPQRATE